jgi:hypothetical protein
MLTLIIPTAARAAMLRTALASVANQSALSKITRIVVSENGGSRESEAVCAEFPALPISYHFRSATLTPYEHGGLLMREHPAEEYTAILHDDDWWGPQHIANALEALEAQPEAAVYGAGHFVVSAESSMLNCSGNLFPWFGADFPAFAPVWRLSRLNVLMAELLGTSAHYSALVMRTEALRKSTYVFDLGNTFDNDRMLIFALSNLGPLLFNPTPEVFVRNHGRQDCFLFDDQARQQRMCGTTRWMVESSGKSFDLIAKTFARRLARCPEAALPTLKILAMKEWCVPEMKRHLAGPVLV